MQLCLCSPSLSQRYFSLYHATVNTTNQNTGKPLNQSLKSIKYFRSCAIGLNASRDRIFLSKRIFPIFENCMYCEKDLKNNEHNSFHLGRKDAQIFVLGHYVPRRSQFSSSYVLGKQAVRFSEQIMSADKYPSL